MEAFWSYNCGSMMRGQRIELIKMMAFSVDIRSLGSPSLFHAAICASSQTKFSGSMPSVCGISGCRKNMRHFEIYFEFRG